MLMLGADAVLPLRGDTPVPDALTFEAGHPDDRAVVTAVAQPVLLEFRPAVPNGRAMLVLGGGGYVALMVGREGVQVARWLTALATAIATTLAILAVRWHVEGLCPHTWPQCASYPFWRVVLHLIQRA